MAKADMPAARAPRGSKPVAQAFFTALEQAPEMSRSAIAKAALAMVRDELKSRRDKAKVAAVKEKEKARKAAPAKPVAEKAPAAKGSPAKPPSAKASMKAAEKAAPAEAMKPNGADHEAPPVKRRGRKPAVLPTTA